MRRAALVVTACLALGGTARADDALVEARRLEAGLEYEKALVIVDREIARGAADRARLVELHLLAGTLAAGIDHPDVAEAHFARVLALAPDTRLPEGTSPKLAEPFAAARAKAVPLRVELRREPARVTATIAADPLKLVAGLRVELVGGAGRTTTATAPAASAPSATSIEVAVPPGLDARGAAAIDEYGNELARETFAPVEHPAHGGTGGPSFVGRWPTWAVASGVALAAGGLCAWRFQVAQDDWNTLEAAGGHDFSELRAIELRGRRWGLAANISFGIGAAAGIAAIVLAVVHRGGDGDGTHVAASGETIGLAGRF